MTSPGYAGGTTTPAQITPVGRGRLALVFQELFTSVVRLSTNRQAVSDAVAFRAHLVHLLQRADTEARAAGYEESDVRLAMFAVVALLDESALNSRQPALADWSRRTLQEELYGGHMGGEWFFQHVEELLARPDSAVLVDLLEVHQLSLLLGFRGKYGSDTGALHAIASRVSERVERSRGALAELSPHWQPGNDAVAGRDPWIPRLAIALGVCVAIAAALWGMSYVSLNGAASDLGNTASTSRASLAASTPR